MTMAHVADDKKTQHKGNALDCIVCFPEESKLFQDLRKGVKE